MKNIWAWLLAVSPLIFFLPFDWVVLLAVYWVVVIVCAAIDRVNMVKDGWMAPSLFTVVIPAIYLLRRANLTENKPILVLVWVAVMIGSFIWAGQVTQQNGLTSSACEVVTQILSEKMNANAKCVKVEIVEKVTDNFYKANAVLDNGRDLKISIKEQDDNRIYVTIPPQF